MSRIYIADTTTDTVIIPNRLFLTNTSQILNRCQTRRQREAAQGPILTGWRWSTLAGRLCNISGRSGSFRIILLNSNAFRTTREGNPNASWEEIIGKAYQTRTQLAAFGFYNTSPLEYEYVTIWVSMRWKLKTTDERFPNLQSWHKHGNCVQLLDKRSRLLFSWTELSHWRL